MKQISKLILSFLLILTLAYSCRKVDDNDNNDNNPIETLNIPDGFLFETTVEHDITVILPTTINFTDLRGRVNIYSDYPDAGGLLLASSSIDADGKARFLLRVPAYTERLFVESISGSAWVELNGNNTKNGGFVIDFNADISLLPPSDTVVEEKSAVFRNYYEAKQAHPYLKQRAVVNLIENGNFSVNDFGAISDWSSPMNTDGRWHITSTLGTNHAKRHTQNNQTMMRITPSPARYGGVAQLVPANPGDLITISADIRSTGHNSNTSWLFLIARNANGESFYFYSLQTYPPNQWVNRSFAATMPPGTVTVQVLLWNHIYGGSIDYTNVVVTGPVSDSDGDGVDDELDDYPNDPLRAFDVYYPNIQDFGSLAYEDLWPGKGDYDFNDLVIDYQFKQVLNGNNELVEFFTDLSVRAIGASFENGFGFSIAGMSSNNIASITGNALSDNYINLNANGTEAGQGNPVIIAFDNAFSMLTHPGESFTINTIPDMPYTDPDTIQLYVSFVEPILFRNTGRAPFNPFLIVNKQRGYEVHLPGQQPTDLADESLFGTYFDATNPATGKYYQSETNLPWAIDLPVRFDYPIEKAEIISAHLRFKEWAESGGNSFTDWYLDMAGYRNAELIYNE